MPTNVFSPIELPPELKRKWTDGLARNPGLPGPCFRPELFEAVAKHYEGVRIAVLEQDGETGFLPFLKDPHHKIAQAIPMCDYQAVIGPAGKRWNVEQTLADLDLVAWDFEYLVGVEALAFSSAYLKSGAASRADLHGGAAAYFDQRRAEDVSLRSLKAKRDKIQRKYGPLRFVPEDGDRRVLQKILEWKAARFNDGRPLDARMGAVLEELFGQDPVRGMLSTLYVGDSVVGAHYGLRYGDVLHYWFPAFNPEFSRFTPGHLLVYELVTHLEAMGAKVLDFGPGGEGYKQYFCNDRYPFVSGGIERFSPFTLARKCRRNLESAVRSTRWLHEGLRPIVRKLRGWKAS